jgi:DNA polymerase III epsilon subunit-like protein
MTLIFDVETNGIRGHIEYWHGVGPLWGKSVYCTMESAKWLYDWSEIKYGEPKWPRLSEAAESFGIDTGKIAEETGLDYHDSLFDVHVTLAVYKHLKSLGPDAVEDARKEFFEDVRNGYIKLEEYE